MCADVLKPEDGDIHLWTTSRAVRIAAKILSEEEMERSERHLAECPTCRAALFPEGEDETGDPESEHISADVIATWATSSTKLVGFERALVRRHLSRCADCREDLRLLGHEPSLGKVSGLELAETPDWLMPSEGSEPKGESALDTIPTRTQVGVRARWKSMGLWTIAGWVVAAVFGAALVLMVKSRNPDAERAERPTPFARDGSDARRETTGPMVITAPPPHVDLIRDTEDSMRSPAEIWIPRGESQLSITLRDSETLPEGALISLVSEDGSTSTASMGRGAFHGSIVVRAPHPFSPGRYRLLLAAPGKDGSPQIVATYTLEIRVRH
jgi:hypothetical protein